jgi:hypothetical protein
MFVRHRPTVTGWYKLELIRRMMTTPRHAPVIRGHHGLVRAALAFGQGDVAMIRKPLDPPPAVARARAADWDGPGALSGFMKAH